MANCLNGEEIAEILRITLQSLTNRIARNGPYQLFPMISKRQRIWLRCEVCEWRLTCRERRSPNRRPPTACPGFCPESEFHSYDQLVSAEARLPGSMLMVLWPVILCPNMGGIKHADGIFAAQVVKPEALQILTIIG